MFRYIRSLAVPMMLLAANAISRPAGAQNPLLLQLHVQSGIRLQADTSGGLVAYGKRYPSCNVIPAAGAGVRMMWYPCKAAFRAGELTPASTLFWNDNNIGSWSWAGGQSTMASGLGSLAFGYASVASGDYSVALGTKAIAEGENAVALGIDAKCTGQSCLAMGNAVVAGAEGAIAIGTFVTADAIKSTALGAKASTNGHRGAFIWGDGGSSTLVTAQADNEFRVRASGGVAFRTSEAASSAAGMNGNAGCDLAAGSGSWSCSSSRYVKENVADVDGEGVLAKISAMPVTTWNYITEDKAVRHMGPFAQDFYAAFQLGTDSASIGMIDINGVNLAAIKALEQRTADLKSAQDQVAEKTMRIDALEERVARLEKVLAKKLK